MTGKKSQKVIFHLFGEKPHWSDLHPKLLCSRWSCRRNHVCQVSKWNFQGLRFCRGRIFHCPIDFWMGLTTVQRYCAACDIANTTRCRVNYRKNMTSSTNRKYITSSLSSDDNWATARITCTENFVNFRLWFLRYQTGQTDRQTYIHAHRNTSHTTGGRSNYVTDTVVAMYQLISTWTTSSL